MKFELLERKDLNRIDYFPLFIDFDFSDLKPRGGSAAIDFFYYGLLCRYMDGSSDSEIVYMRKNDLPSEQGFFLLDFAKVSKGIINIEKIISGLNIKKLYIEKSYRFPLDKFLVIEG